MAARSREALLVHLDVSSAAMRAHLTTLLERRGISVEWTRSDQSRCSGIVPDVPLDIPFAARWSQASSQAATAGRPLVILGVPTQEEDPLDAAAARAYLGAHGAILLRDPDAWLETLVLVCAHGLPAGDRVAIVAPPASWTHASAQSIAGEWRAAPQRPDTLGDGQRWARTDVVLVDDETLGGDSHRLPSPTLVIPVRGRGEWLPAEASTRVPLIGLRAALSACRGAGRLARQLRLGLGPAATRPEYIEPDEARFQRQVAKLGPRAGDHESKVLLASYHIPITRQAVATTPSAATAIAKRAGFPVELKPWGPAVPQERDGCPVARGLRTGADVRRAFANLAVDIGLAADAPVIVRETPPRGRTVRIRFRRSDPIGWILYLDIEGAPAPVAAIAPLRHHDAIRLAARVEATRADDSDLPRDELADILERASFLVSDHGNLFQTLDFDCTVATAEPRRSVIVDACATLAR